MSAVQQVTPVLNVSNMEASFAWFEKWGWKKLWDYGTPPDFGAVRAGDCEIFLCLDQQGGRGESGTWLCVAVEDVDAVYERCRQEKLEIKREPWNAPWNMREMTLRHPDGHMFRVGTNTACD